MAEQKTVDLQKIFGGLQKQMIAALATNNDVIRHPGTKGATTELRWLTMLNGYLPKRYSADSAFVLDCEGHLSQQIDIVIYDRQYSPFLFNDGAAKYIPAESVYAVLEVKPDLDSETTAYAGEKASSVRRLRRTSAPIFHAGGKHAPKEPPRIIAGIVTLDSTWKQVFGDTLAGSLSKLKVEEQLDVGCVLRHGGFEVLYAAGGKPQVQASAPETSLIFFFLKLLARLQAAGTVAALDLDQYGKAL